MHVAHAVHVELLVQRVNELLEERGRGARNRVPAAGLVLKVGDLLLLLLQDVGDALGDVAQRDLPRLAKHVDDLLCDAALTAQGRLEAPVDYLAVVTYADALPLPAHRHEVHRVNLVGDARNLVLVKVGLRLALELARVLAA